jgi:hypothetical protein
MARTKNIRKSLRNWITRTTTLQSNSTTSRPPAAGEGSPSSCNTGAPPGDTFKRVEDGASETSTANVVEEEFVGIDPDLRYSNCRNLENLGRRGLRGASNLESVKISEVEGCPSCRLFAEIAKLLELQNVTLRDECLLEWMEDSSWWWTKNNQLSTMGSRLVTFQQPQTTCSDLACLQLMRSSAFYSLFHTTAQ